ncbi:amidohydrolase family protein [Microbacterium sp. NPDC056044]|uniref:amidohydrolase family protein n=1 Tax=Microbacterium sp. NPDC056044 TaxID=3345690 RepID=UPI0035DC5D88
MTARSTLTAVKWGPHSERVCDVEIRDGRIARVLPAADGGARTRADTRVLAGLHDRHLHLLALAGAAASVVCPVEMSAPAWREAIRGHAVGPDGWLRVTGAHESFTGDLDARALDALRADVPVRVQHRTGMLWTLNTAALERVGPLDHEGIERDDRGEPTGRLWRADAWLRERVPTRAPDLAAVGRLLLRHGITAVTDATPDLDASSLRLLEDAVRCGDLPQRLTLLGAPLGWRPEVARVRVGAFKLVLDEADLPDLDALAARIAEIHAAGRPVAVHCVTAASAHLLVLALEAAGVRRGDRVEHGSVLPPAVIERLAALRVRVVTQPGFLSERGDAYLSDVDPADLPSLYPMRDLCAAGVRVRYSSDAPYGPLDPARWLRDAVERRTASGQVAVPEQRVSWRQALRGLAAGPRIGARADVIVVDAELERIVRDRRSPFLPRRVLIDGEDVDVI